MYVLVNKKYEINEFLPSHPLALNLITKGVNLCGNEISYCPNDVGFIGTNLQFNIDFLTKCRFVKYVILIHNLSIISCIATDSFCRKDHFFKNTKYPYHNCFSDSNMKYR